jgi:hypothetical protein
MVALPYASGSCFDDFGHQFDDALCEGKDSCSHGKVKQEFWPAFMLNGFQVFRQTSESCIDNLEGFGRVFAVKTPRLYTHLYRDDITIGLSTALEFANRLLKSFQPLSVHHTAPPLSPTILIRLRALARIC